MAEWWAMSGYGPYVLGAYAVTAGVLIGLLVWSWRRFRASRALLARLEQAAPRRYAMAGSGAEASALAPDQVDQAGSAASFGNGPHR